jgi:hypothetical protein
LYLCEEPGIAQSNSDLVSQDLQDGDIIVSERRWLCALYVKHASRLAPYPQWQCHLGPSIGQD